MKPSSPCFSVEIKDRELIVTEESDVDICNKCNKHLDHHPEAAAAIRKLIACEAYTPDLYDEIAAEMCGACPDNVIAPLSMTDEIFDMHFKK